MNTVVETAEQTRQSFRPRQPRVEIDMSYVQGELETADADRPVGREDTGYNAPSAGHPSATATQATAQSSESSPEPAGFDQGEPQEADDRPSYEDALTELAALRELAEVFESEFDKEQAARAAVEAERDEARQLAAATTRDLESARAALAATPKAAKQPDDSQFHSRIDELQAEIKREQESRLAVLAQLESTRQQVREAQREAAVHREAAVKAAAHSVIAIPGTADAGAVHEQIELLRADFQAELTAEQSIRRATEAQRDLAERRVAAANRELEALRAIAAQAKAAAALETELASAQSARGVLVRELDEAKARIAALEQATAARNAAEADALSAARQDALSQRDMAQKAKADLAAEKSARATLDRQVQAAQHRIADLERDIAARSEADDEAIAAAIRDAETQRDLAHTAKAELVTESAAREALADDLKKAALQLRALEQEIASRDATGGQALAAARRDAETHRSEIAKISAALAIEQATAAASRAAADAAERRISDLQRKIAAREASDGEALAAVQQEAQAQLALAEQIRSELEAERTARAAAEHKLGKAEKQITDLQRQLASRGASDHALGDMAAQSDALRARTAELETALALEKSVRGDMEAEQAQRAFRLSEMQSKLAAQSETIDRLEAQLQSAQSDAGSRNADSDAAGRRITELEREIEALRSSHTRAIDVAMQESATQRVLAVQLAAELKGERAALDSIAAQLAEAKLRVSEMQRERANRPATDTNPLSSLINAVGAIPPKASVRTAQSALLNPGKVPPTARPDTLPQVAAIAEETTSTEDTSAPLLARAQSMLKPAAKPSLDDEMPEGRRERRTSAHSPATIWRDGMSQPLNCTIRNRSSGGALLEFPADRHGDEISEFSIGDELTLTFTSYRERSSVTCIVARIEGRTCGVKFAGQFHIQMLKPLKPKKPLGKPELAKVGR